LVTRLDDALERMDREGIAMILLDLTFPDGQSLEAFEQVFLEAERGIRNGIDGT
jgi:DNA-binding response OmpR family regulator